MRPRNVIAALALALGAAVAADLREQRRRPATRALADFRRRYERALADRQLSANLLTFQRAWRQSRDAAFADYRASWGEAADFAALRRRLAAAKDRALDDLEGTLRQFRANAERAGAIVYEASSVADANHYVLDLARRKGVRLVVKSKSMVSEETELGHALEANGIRAVETDLGEWIVQLAHERPSHMVMPAIHKSRQQVGELFTRATGREVPREEIAAQVQVARTELRAAFLTADLGISGANALIAESGTVMLVTNEGNGRLVTSLPPVHVVLAGIEKLVPTFEDALLQLRLLGRSATAQPITSYTTFITGPDRPGRELHIVLLDNGRRRMAADPDFRDALRCIRCAACANVCPPYQVVGGHVFGYIYSGAIGLVNTPFHHGIEHAAGPQSLCVSCNACATVCPVEIPLPRQILDVRHRAAERLGLPWYKRLALAVWARPRLFDAAARLGALANRPLARAGLTRLPIPLPEPLRWRTPPALAGAPARDQLPRLMEPDDGGTAGAGAPQRTPGSVRDPAGPIPRPRPLRGLTVAVLLQCLADRLYPAVPLAVARVLAALGARVVVPPEQHCCGLPAHDSGDEARARRMAQQTIATFERVAADYVVTGAASCAVAIVHDYPHLFRHDPAWRARAERLAARTLDFTTFLDRVAQLPPGALADPARPGPVVTYHHFCQSANVLGLADAPLRLLRDVLGLEVRELAEASVCCGFGGSFSLDHPRVARAIVERKLQNVDATGAAVLVSDNPGCLLHLRGAADASGRRVRVAHLAELIAERLVG